MLNLYGSSGLTRTHFVTGVAEHEESGEYESRQEYCHNHQPLVAGQVIARLPDFGGKSPLRCVPHLII